MAHKDCAARSHGMQACQLPNHKLYCLWYRGVARLFDGPVGRAGDGAVDGAVRCEVGRSPRRQRDLLIGLPSGVLS